MMTRGPGAGRGTATSMIIITVTRRMLQAVASNALQRSTKPAATSAPSFKIVKTCSQSGSSARAGAVGALARWAPFRS